MVDDDLEVAVGTALVLERVLDLRDRAFKGGEVVLAHGAATAGTRLGGLALSKATQGNQLVRFLTQKG